MVLTVVNSCGLRTTDRHHLLGCADGSGAHADAKRVDSPRDEVASLRDANHLQKKKGNKKRCYF